MEREGKAKPESRRRGKFLRRILIFAIVGIGLYAWLHLFSRDKGNGEKNHGSHGGFPRENPAD